MKCLNPTVVKHPHYAFKFLAPCGKCVCCQERKRKEWVFRMEEESKVNDWTAFVTLTYDDEHLPFSSFGDSINLYFVI